MQSTIVSQSIFQFPGLPASKSAQYSPTLPLSRTTLNFSRFERSVDGGLLKLFQTSGYDIGFRHQHVRVGETSQCDYESGSDKETPKIALPNTGSYQSPNKFINAWKWFSYLFCSTYFVDYESGLDQETLKLVLTNTGSYQSPNMFMNAWRTFKAFPKRILSKVLFRVYKKTPSPVSSDELVGLEEPIAKMKIFISYLKRESVNKYIPRGLLIHGPTRSGKTTAVHAMAREAKVALFSVDARCLANKSGTNDMSTIKRIFLEARIWAPSIILIENIDAIFKNPTDSYINYLYELLEEIDECISYKLLVLVIATTKQDLEKPDKELLSLRHFFMRLSFTLPDEDARRKLICQELGESFKKENEQEIIDTLVSKTQSLNAIDIEAIFYHARIEATLLGEIDISKEDIFKGIEVVLDQKA